MKQILLPLLLLGACQQKQTGSKKGSVPLDNLNASFDYSGIIGPVHACSLAKENLKSAEINGSKVTYAVCDLKTAE